MADLLRSAFGYFASGYGDAAGQHELVGRTLQLSDENQLTVKKVLAEGEPPDPLLCQLMVYGIIILSSVPSLPCTVCIP